MNRLLVLCVLALIGVSFAQDTFFDQKRAGNRDTNVIQTFKDPINIPGNLDNNGLLTVSVTADTNVIVCINEKIQVTAGINSCSLNGRLNFTWPNTTVPEAVTKQVYLRFGRPYYLSYQLEWNRPIDKNDTEVHIVITGKRCEDASKEGPGCGSDDKITKIVVGQVYDNTVDSFKNNYFYFTSTEQYNEAVALVTRNLTRDHIFLYSRVGAYPLFVNKAIVDGTVDRQGDDGDDNTTIRILFPRPDTYWFTIASNDTENVKYTFTFTTGKTTSVGDVNATTPAFGATLDNNTIEYKATPKGVSFRYFTFTTNELKLGVAPQDDSDGAPDVFADLTYVPSADSNLIANTNSSEEAHLVSATTVARSAGFFWYTFRADAQQATDSVWVVAINSTNDFVIWDANIGGCAQNCTKRGKCDETTGICICDDGYERYDCSDKVFPLVWIILIAIGGAILLAIAIGVPVSCYVKNKKKSGYERV